MSDTHQVNVVRIETVRPHPNADKLELTDIGGYQVVIGKGSFKVGDLAVYIQPDNVVPQTEPFKFIWGDHVGIDGVVPERRRRITVKRLRKEFSEGLLMPVTDFPNMFYNGENTGLENLVTVGQDVAELLGVTHYVPAFDQATSADTAAMPKRKYPRSLRGWFYFLLRKLGLRNAGGRSYAQEVSFDLPVYDVNAYKNHKNWCPEGTLVQVTEKIHGSNARFVFILDDENKPLGSGTFYAGSHEQWKTKGPCVWWNVVAEFPEIEEWCTQNPGKVLYGEVGPTQGDNFRYGAEPGKPFFFAFDVYNPATGEWDWAGGEGFAQTVPVLYVGHFGEDVFKLVDGQTTVPGAKGIREGVVIRILGNTTSRGKLKLVSNAYLEKDSK